MSRSPCLKVWSCLSTAPTPGREALPLDATLIDLTLCREVYMSQSAAPLMLHRGAPRRQTGHMERYQIAWLNAVAAATGCLVQTPEVIDDGIDATLFHKHPTHTCNSEKVAALHVQLKATTSPVARGNLKVKVSRERFAEYAVPSPSIATVVVGLTMPKLQSDWLQLSASGLLMKSQSYWINLEGEVAPVGTSKKVDVPIPVSQVFDDFSLLTIMNRIGQGGRP